MKIQRLQITIEPWALSADRRILRVQVETDGELKTFERAVSENEFRAFFDCLMDEASREIKRLCFKKPDERT